MAIKTKSSAPASQVSRALTGDFGIDAWDEVPDEVERRSYTCLIYGDTGTGRTRLALTAPGPLALAHTAEKVDGIMQRAKRENPHLKLIRAHNFGAQAHGSNQEIAAKIRPVWDGFVNRWNNAVDDWARSAVCDTTTEAWEQCRLAFFGELNPRGRIDNLYGPVNNKWRAVFKRNKNTEPKWRCNIIMIGQTKDEYRDVIKNGQKVSEKTGKTIYVGQRELPIISDVIIRTDKYIDKQGLHFTATIEKGWLNADTVEGMVFENEDCRLPYIISFCSGIPEEEWSV